MKKNTLLVCILLFVAGILGCQVMAGECWPVSEDGQGAGVGGGPLVPGTGGYGVSPEPQSADDDEEESEDGAWREQSSGGAPPPGCVAIGKFPASLFKFSTTLADDGGGDPGGWQQASATLTFVDARHDPPPAWICNVTIGMPLRTAAHGSISASRAANIAAAVTTKAGAVIHTRASWQPSLFCAEFQDKMNDIFYWDYQGLGARGTAKR